MLAVGLQGLHAGVTTTAGRSAFAVAVRPPGTRRCGWADGFSACPQRRTRMRRGEIATSELVLRPWRATHTRACVWPWGPRGDRSEARVDGGVRAVTAACSGPGPFLLQSNLPMTQAPGVLRVARSMDESIHLVHRGASCSANACVLRPRTVAGFQLTDACNSLRRRLDLRVDKWAAHPS